MWRLRMLWKDFTKTRIEEERSLMYTPFRYHPVRLGERFNQRYEVVGKLGWGQYSTVWLAKDKQTEQYVSLKVLTADTKKEKAENERDALINLRDMDPSHPGHDHIIHLLDAFYHEGPNGQHMCLAYKAMGENIRRSQSRMPDQKFSLPLLKKVARQLLQALDHMHNCGWVHTDIKSENIFTYLDEKKVLPSFLADKVVAERQAAQYPDSPIITTQMDASDDIADLKIRLGDFGEVERVRENAADEVQPYGYRAPEVILLAGWDSKIDIWNFACVIWEIFERRRLIGGVIVPKGPLSYQGILWSMVHQMGPAPQQFRELELGRLFFDDAGDVRGVLPRRRFKLNNFRDWEENLKGQEQAEFFEFMQSMLQWLPQDRLSAEQLLEHKWLQVEVPSQ